MVGVRVNVMIAVSFAIGAALAGAAGLLLANQFFVTPEAGTDFIIKAYIAVTIGGWGSLAGAVSGALLIALFEVGVSALMSYTAASAALYAALLAILFFRPQGLFGEASAAPRLMTRPAIRSASALSALAGSGLNAPLLAASGGLPSTRSSSARPTACAS